MKSIITILENFLTDLQTDLPALLSAQGLDNFDKYAIGPSRNESEKALCIYKESSSEDPREGFLKIIFQMQLFKIEYDKAEEYSQIVYDYLLAYDVDKLGMNFINEIRSESWPLQDNRTTFCFVDVEWKEILDGCD